MNRPVLRLGTWTQRLLALAGFGAGTIFGTVIQGALDSGLEVLSASVGVLCLLVLALVTHLSDVRSTSESVRESTVEGLAKIDRSIRSSLDLFSKNLDLRVRCQMLHETNNYESPDQDLVVQAFRNAKREILVLDYLTDEGVRPDVEMKPIVMKWHLEAIEARARGGVVYRRYCQVSDPDRPFRNVRTDADGSGGGEYVFVDHCISMCDMRSSAVADVTLKVAPKIFPYKFLIIDQSVLILQLHEVDGSGLDQYDDPRTMCELVIEDPQRVLIEHFLNMWQKVDRHARTRSITGSDPAMAHLRDIRGRS